MYSCPDTWRSWRKPYKNRCVLFIFRKYQHTDITGVYFSYSVSFNTVDCVGPQYYGRCIVKVCGPQVVAGINHNKVALNSITIGPKEGDDDTTEININGNTSEIDDVFLTNVERDDETNEVVFNLNNGKDPIRVNVDELDNPNIDGSTF